ncbi:hypothetical protein ENBRE01_1142 [Enteropsectra breve]|nr:hypothetical protein ENBRE01_1142 [Enteropsectra breve]
MAGKTRHRKKDDQANKTHSNENKKDVSPSDMIKKRLKKRLDQAIEINANKFNGVWKYMMLKKKHGKSPVKNFFLIIYHLYYRYTIETGVSSMSTFEALIVNTCFLLFFWSAVNRCTLLFYDFVVWGLKMAKCFISAYSAMGSMERYVYKTEAINSQH